MLLHPQSARTIRCRTRSPQCSLTACVLLLSSVMLIFMLSDNIRGSMTANDAMMLVQRRLLQLQRIIDSISASQFNESNALIDLRAQLHSLSLLCDQDSELAIPSICDVLPHVFNTLKSALAPSLIISGPFKRNNVFAVIGIPTIQRSKVSYLIATLRSLINNLTPEQKKDILFVIMIADEKGAKSMFVQEQAATIQKEFHSAIDDGFLEIVVPPTIWYPPDLGKLPSPLNEKPERLYWRTKQTFDYIYLMMWCQKRGRYYMQLEDDIITTSGYIDRMRQFIAHNAHNPWLMLELSSLGFIGKLFRTSDLPLFINFFLMFHKERPVDWLLDVLFDVRYCTHGQKHELCRKTVLQHRILINPPLFQHVGVQSSLEGKVQRLKEIKFKNSSSNLYVPHKTNPKAALSTSLRAYKNYSLENAYNGDSLFWGLLPQSGDYIRFDYDPPLNIRVIIFHSGNADFPLDRFYNATVEVLYVGIAVPLQEKTEKVSAFTPVGVFDGYGNVRISIKPVLPIASLRIVNHVESEHWLILSEIWVR